MPDTFDPYLNWLGIEPHERPLDHYRLLGLARFESRREVILAAADQRMGYIRSFQAGVRGAHTQKLLNELATAKLCLLDAGARGAYDAALKARLVSPAEPPAAPPLPPPAPAVPPPAAPAEAFSVGNALRGVPASPVAGSFCHAETMPAAEAPAAADDSPFYTRPWFPIAVVASVLLVAGLTWGANKLLMNRAEAIAERERLAAENLRAAAESPLEPAEPPLPEPAPAAIIEQGAGGDLSFPAVQATLHGAAELGSRGGEQVVTNWQSEEDWVSWNFHLKKPGIFRVVVTYLAAPESSGGRYEVAIGDERKSNEIRTFAKSNGLVTDTLFLAIKKGGRHTLTVRGKQLRGKELFSLKSVELTPRAGGR